MMLAMTTIDYILGISFILLIIVVILRIWLSRKASAIENSETSSIKEMKGKSEDTTGQDANEAAAATDSQQVRSCTESEDNIMTDSNVDAQQVENEAESEDEEFDEAIDDPIVLIKTFSAPTKKRIKAIQTVGENRVVEAVPSLIEALYEPDAVISNAAANSLGQIGDERAIEPLLEVSRRNDAHLINQINEQKSDAAELEDANTSSIASNTTEESPYNFKELTVFKIDQLPQEYFQPDGSPIPRKDLVVKGLKDNNQQLRQMAAKAAIGVDSDEVVEPLIDVLKNPFEVESVRFMAAEALGGIQDDRSIEPLLDALKDENVAVRYSAAAALSGRKEDQVVMALIGAISDPDKFVRSSVAYALGTTSDERALSALFECLSDQEEVVSFSAAKAISGFGPDRVVTEVENRLEFANKSTKMALYEALGQIKDERALNILRDALNDPDTEISYKASMALMGYENLEILDELIEASRRLDEDLMGFMDGKELKSSIKTTTEDKASRGVSELESIQLPENMEKLRENLSDPSPNIRGSAANTIGDFQTHEAVLLLKAVANDENEYVRSAVVNSLGKIGLPECFDLLCNFMEDPSEEVRYALVKALPKFENEHAISKLEELHKKDSSKEVKRSARIALESLKNS